jgi:hypothetical protein
MYLQVLANYILETTAAEGEQIRSGAGEDGWRSEQATGNLPISPKEEEEEEDVNMENCVSSCSEPSSIPRALSNKLGVMTDWEDSNTQLTPIKRDTVAENLFPQTKSEK